MAGVEHEISDDKCCVFHHDITEDERLAENIIDKIHQHGCLHAIGELDILKEKCSQNPTQDCCLVGNSCLLIMVLVTQHLLECKRCDKWQSDFIIAKIFDITVIPLISENIRNKQRHLRREGLLLKSRVPLNIEEDHQTWSKKLVRAIIASFDKKSKSDSRENALTRRADIRTDVLYNLRGNMQFHCFIYSSPSKTDVRTVKIIGEFLEDHNYSYVSADKFCPGESYLDCLTHFVQNSQKIFVIVSSDFQSDPRCSKELKQIIMPFCIEYENKTIPIVMGESELPDVLQAVIPIIESNPNWQQKLLTCIEDVDAEIPQSSIIKGKGKGYFSEMENLGSARYSSRPDDLCYEDVFIFLHLFQYACLKQELNMENIWTRVCGLLLVVWYYVILKNHPARGLYRSGKEIRMILEILLLYQMINQVLYSESMFQGYYEVVLLLLYFRVVKIRQISPLRSEKVPNNLLDLLQAYHMFSKAYLEGGSSIPLALVYIVCLWWLGYFDWIIKLIGRIQYRILILKKRYRDLKTKSKQLEMSFIYVQYNHKSKSLTWIPVCHRGYGMYGITSTLLTPENSLLFTINTANQRPMPIFPNPARISQITDIFV